MQKILKTILTATVATTGMTAGSAIMSALVKQNFREPEHLGTMVSRLLPLLPKKAKTVAGWGAHYLMGLVFAAVFVELWERGKIKPDLKNAMGFGVIAGLAGALIWKASFKVHPLPPAMKYINFYIQRIPAHVVYTLFATATYRLLQIAEAKQAPATISKKG